MNACSSYVDPQPMKRLDGDVAGGCLAVGPRQRECLGRSGTVRCGKLRTVGAWWLALTVALLMIAVFSASAIAAWRGRLTGYASARIVRTVSGRVVLTMAAATAWWQYAAWPSGNGRSPWFCCSWLVSPGWVFSSSARAYPAEVETSRWRELARFTNDRTLGRPSVGAGAAMLPALCARFDFQ
jgi:hypothetical protein